MSFSGIQNLFEEAYNRNVWSNAFGAVFSEAAPELNVDGGLSAAYNWSARQKPR